MKYKTVAFAVFVAVVAAYVGYFATLPVPDGLPEPWKMRGFVMFRHMLFWVSKLFTATFSQKILKGVQQGRNSSLNITDTEFGDVPVRIFATPDDKQTGQLPALVFFHGGGWVKGSIDTYHFVTDDIATKLGQVLLVSVEYRLALEEPFPAAIDDCTSATTFLLQHASEYNVDPNRVGVFGDSAGGNLAAAVAQRLTFDPKYVQLPKLKLQALIYPALQAVDFQMPSYQQNGDYDTLVLTKKHTIAYWGIYLTGKRDILFEQAAFVNNHTSASTKMAIEEQNTISHNLVPDNFKVKDYDPPIIIKLNTESSFNFAGLQNEILNPDLSPLLRNKLQGLPQTYIATCNFDVLRDDGVIYANRLEGAGVLVTWKHYEGGTHGSMSMNHDGLFKLEAGIQIRHDLITFLSESLNK